MATTHLQIGQFKITGVADASVIVVGYVSQADTSACMWDSGAPCLTENADGSSQTLLSVESDGPACPHSQNETTERVDRIADWIQQTIG
jgi:hypothetical protein